MRSTESAVCHDLVALPCRGGLEMLEGMTIGRDFDVWGQVYKFVRYEDYKDISP